ncbi:hypothetical protein [Micromonospora sp. NPDC004704]
MIDEIAGWSSGLDDLLGPFAYRLGWAEPRRHAHGYLLGLLSPLTYKNGGSPWGKTPDRMQRLLNKAEVLDPGSHDFGSDLYDLLVRCVAHGAMIYGTPITDVVLSEIAETVCRIYDTPSAHTFTSRCPP